MTLTSPVVTAILVGTAGLNITVSREVSGNGNNLKSLTYSVTNSGKTITISLFC